MYDFLSSEKYLLLRQVVMLWILLIALLLLVKHKIPNRTVHNIVNLSLGVASVVEFVAIIVISVRYVF